MIDMAPEAGWDKSMDRQTIMSFANNLKGRSWKGKRVRRGQGGQGGQGGQRGQRGQRVKNNDTKDEWNGNGNWEMTIVRILYR